MESQTLLAVLVTCKRLLGGQPARQPPPALLATCAHLVIVALSTKAKMADAFVTMPFRCSKVRLLAQDDRSRREILRGKQTAA